MTQLKEGLRIAQKFPMEYPQLQDYRERINTFLVQVSKHLAMGRGVSEAQLRDVFTKIKSIAETCMNKQILDKMKKHHLALKRQHYEQQAAAKAAAAASGRGSASLGSVLAGSSADELNAALSTLKAKVMKLLPIRQHIKTKLETAPHVPAQFKHAYTTIRKKIERIAKYFTEECKTLAHVAKCTQYLHATFGEWKQLIATHQEWLKKSNGQTAAAQGPPPPAAVPGPGPPAVGVGAATGHGSTQAAQAQAQAVAAVKAHMRASVQKLRELFDSYKQMVEFRSATKAKEAGSDAVSDEDKTLFTDEVHEVKQLQSMVHAILQRANTSAVRLPEGVTKRIDHLDYSLRLRQQFVLYSQLHTLEKCASWCANAKGGEWYLQLQEPVNKLIAEIAMLKRSKVPSPHTPSVFHKFLNFRKQAAQHQRAGATSPGTAGAGATATSKLTSADAKKAGITSGGAAKSRKNNARSYGAAMALVGQQMGLGPPTGAGAPTSAKQSAAAAKKAAASAKRAAAAKKKSDAAKKKAADAAAARKKKAEAAAAAKASKAAAAAAKKARGHGGRSPSAATTAALKRKKAAAAAAAAAATAAGKLSPDLKRQRAAGGASAASAALPPVRTGMLPGGALSAPTSAAPAGGAVGSAPEQSPFHDILQQLKRRKEEEDAAKSGRPSN